MGLKLSYSSNRLIIIPPHHFADGEYTMCVLYFSWAGLVEKDKL